MLFACQCGGILETAQTALPFLAMFLAYGGYYLKCFFRR